jgi:hypothetical protein
MFETYPFRSLSRSLVLPCTMLLSAAALSQTGGQGAITGSVLDLTGAAIPNASIIAVNKATGVQTRRTASDDGVYALTPLLPGTYTVTVTANGFSTFSQQNIVVDALGSVGLNVTLKTGSASEVVNVSSAPPVLETTNAALGGVIENDVYAALPLLISGGQQRDITQFSNLLPGAQVNPGGRSSIIGGTGQRVGELYLDGLPLTTLSLQGDNRPIFNIVPLEAIDQIRVVTSGFSAEYQGAGLENYNLKSGGNQYHGSLFAYVRNTLFDTWTFSSKPGGANVVPTLVNGALVNLPGSKPAEHQFEVGYAVGGPVKIPFLFNGHDKLFFYSVYDKFHSRLGANPVPASIASLAERQGDFSAVPYAIYDPTSQASCTAHSTTGACRYQFGYGPGASSGANGNPVLVGKANVIPAGEVSPISQYQQQFLPQPFTSGYVNNYAAGAPSGFDNFLFSERLDYTISPKQTLAVSYAQGSRHAVPYTGAAAPGVAVVPYITTTLSTVTGNIADLQHTYTFSPHLVNQFKYGFIYFGGPPVGNITGMTNPGLYGLAASGVTNLPAGQASMDAANTAFSGANSPTGWVGNTPTTTNRSVTYEALDNIFLLKGRHSMNFGGQIQWLENNSDTADGASTPTSLTYSLNDTAQLSGTSFLANTGYSYASYLLGAVGSSGVTQQAFSIVGGRFRPAALYFQDDYKITPKLTLNAGLRWDYIPPYHEALSRYSFLNSTLTNPITGTPGALQFAGNRGAGVSCQCATPVATYYKNFEPRLGFAYAANDKTVFRGGYSLNYSHGGGTGGAAGAGTGTGQAGFNTALAFADNTSGPAFYLNNNPSFSQMNSNYGGPGFVLPGTSPVSAATEGQSTGYYVTSAGAFSGTGASINYADPRISGRAPEFSFFSFGIQREVTNNLTISVDYSGSQSHFISGASNIRGFYAGQLDPKYLVLGSYLNGRATTANIAAAQAATGLTLPVPYPGYTAAAALSSSVTIAHMLTWKPQYAGTADYWGNYVANGNYNSMQIALAERASKGLTFNVNYTYSQNADDAGTQRSGYAIPASAIATGMAYPKNRIDRSISINDQPENLSIYGVYSSQYGRGSLGGSHFYTRALLGGWQTSMIYQYAAGLPLPVVGTCNTMQNVGQGTCMNDLNPNYQGKTPRVNGKWGNGVTAATLGTMSYLTGYIPTTASGAGLGSTSTVPVPCGSSSGPFCNSGNYMIGDAPRFPYGLRGPGNYRLSMALRRNFAMTERVHFIFGVDGSNLLNSVTFGSNGGNNQIGVNANSANFGTLNFASADSRDFQFSGRIQF